MNQAVEGYGKVHPHMLELSENDLVAIKALIDQKDYPTAQRLLNSYLFDYQLDDKAIFLFGKIMLATENQFLAAVIFDWLRMRSDKPRIEVLISLMIAYSRCTMYKESVEVAEQVLAIDPKERHARTMISTCNVQLGNYDQAIAQADEILAENPKSVQATVNKGFSYLHLREYGKGWDFYESGLGLLHWRDLRVYDGEPLWDGRMGKDVHVLVYSEQGIGDQVAGIEPLRELMDKVTVVALDCDPKMRAWFGKNFSELPILDGDGKKPPTLPEGIRIDFSAPLFSLHKHLRKSEDAYRKKPFLKPDPDLHIGWKAIFDAKAKGRPIIALAWSGGGVMTGKKDRRIKVDSFAPLFERLDAYYVCMEYRERAQEIEYLRGAYGVDIDHFDAARAHNYNEVAAMLSAVDYFIAPPTAAVHAAGAMGVRTFCLVHRAPNIHYASFGETMPYYGSVRLIRKSEREDREVIDSIVDEVLVSQYINAGQKAGGAA